MLSRAGDFPEKVDDACKLIKNLNGKAKILSKPWGRIAAEEILYPRRGEPAHSNEGRDLFGHIQHGCCGHPEHDHGCGHDHGHSAEEVFETVTIRTKRVFSREELKARIASMERAAKGTVLRAKGIVRSPGGYVNLQYLPGDLRITDCAAGGDMLCIIGRNLNGPELIRLFSGE